MGSHGTRLTPENWEAIESCPEIGNALRSFSGERVPEGQLGYFQSPAMPKASTLERVAERSDTTGPKRVVRMRLGGVLASTVAYPQLTQFATRQP